VAWIGMLVAWLIKQVQMQPSVPTQTELVTKHRH